MSKREQIWFSIGLALGAVFGMGATLLIVSARPLHVAPPAQVPMEPTPTPEPLPNYDATPIQTIRESLRGLSLSQREAVRVYEEAHLKRRGILNVLTALEEERAHGNT